MAQLSLYIDDETMEGLRLDAAARGESLSKYVRQMLSARPQQRGSRWPVGFFDLYGSVADASFEEPGELEWEDDALREEL